VRPSAATGIVTKNILPAEDPPRREKKDWYRIKYRDEVSSTHRAAFRSALSWGYCAICLDPGDVSGRKLTFLIFRQLVYRWASCPLGAEVSICVQRTAVRGDCARAKFFRSIGGLMNQRIAVGLAMVAGIAIAGIAVGSLNAQGKSPGAYAIIDISEVSVPDLIKQIVEKAGPAAASAGDVDKAKAWYGSPAQKKSTQLPTKR
jgi:hypothetical protein